MPRLYVEAAVGAHDKELRKQLYEGALGRFYQFLMPFLVLPVRRNFKAGWVVFFALWLAMLGLVSYSAFSLVGIVRGERSFEAYDAAVAVVLAFAAFVLVKNRFLVWVLILALPVKIGLSRKGFEPSMTFGDLHRKVIDNLRTRSKLQVLDISTGSCNSLFRHGWMDLPAEYTGLDLSETMLSQGQNMMASNGVPIDLVLGDATTLPFCNETFDVALNYGALNGFTDPGRALSEMARVLKPGGLLFVLDEQMYEAASAIERLYFSQALSNHNTIHRAPVDLLPDSIERVETYQIYEFYYIMIGYKAA